MIRAVAFWAVLIVQSASTKPATATVQGVVITADTGAPLAGAHVTFYEKPGTPDPNAVVIITTRTSGDGREPAEAGTLAITDSRGQFEFKNLAADSYSFSAERNGYRSQVTEYTPVSAGQTVTHVLIRMTPLAAVTGRVSGHIRDATGRPVPLVSVRLVKRNYDANGRPQFEEDATSYTNDLGEYRMYGVEPGRYYVVAASEAYGIQNDNAVHGNYTVSFYPGVIDVGAAAIIEVRAAAETAGIDFPVNRSALHRIRGRIVDSRTGQPAESSSVYVSHLILFGATSNRASYNPNNGQFESSALPSGTYALEARLDGDRNEDSAPTAYAAITVGDFDVDGVVLVLAPPSSVSGQIRIDGQLPAGATLESIGTGIELIPEGDLALLNGAGGRPRATVKADGNFKLSGIPEGVFRIGLSWPPPGFYLREARLDGADVLSMARTFSRATTLEIVLAKGGQLDGIVRNENQEPVSPAEAVLIPTDRNRTDLFKKARTDDNSHFIFQGVAPGDYKVFVWQQIEENAYFDPEFLKTFEALGQPVHVTDSSSKTVEVTTILRQPAQ